MLEQFELFDLRIARKKNAYCSVKNRLDLALWLKWSNTMVQGALFRLMRILCSLKRGQLSQHKFMNKMLRYPGKLPQIFLENNSKYVSVYADQVSFMYDVMFFNKQYINVMLQTESTAQVLFLAKLSYSLAKMWWVCTEEDAKQKIISKKNAIQHLLNQCM